MAIYSNIYVAIIVKNITLMKILRVISFINVKHGSVTTDSSNL
jgi:hypothetical protein